MSESATRDSGDSDEESRAAIERRSSTGSLRSPVGDSFGGVHGFRAGANKNFRRQDKAGPMVDDVE